MLRVCPVCKRSYASDAEYCNYCEVDLSHVNDVARFVGNSKSKKLMCVANVLLSIAIATLVIFVVVFFVGGGRLVEPFARACLLIFGVVYWLHIIFYRKSRLNSQLPAVDLLKEDGRPPVLFLRSFNRDGVLIAKNKWLNIRQIFLPGIFESEVETFEEHLAEVLFELGPPVAINDPRRHGKLVDIGVARMDANEDWQAVVENLCRQSRYIVLMVDATDGVQWELSTVLGTRDRIRLLIIPPVQGWRSKRKFSRDYATLQQRFRILPIYQPGLVAILFQIGSPEGRPILGGNENPTPSERILIIGEIVQLLCEESHISFAGS